jgi:hypothetical protein
MSTDTLEFPAIDTAAPAPSHKTELATASTQAIDIATVNLTDLALAKFGPWREQTKTAKAEFASLALNLSTQTAIDDAISLRNRKIKQPLADARKTAEALKSKLAAVSKAVGAELPLIEAGWADAASAITPRIEAAQKALDDAKAEAARKEAERLEALRAKVDECMAAWLARCGVEGITAERVEAGIGMLGNMTMPIDAGLEDVADHWDSAKLLTIGKMENIRLALARAELQAQREEQARQEAERAAQQAAELQKARDEAARVTGLSRRISEIHAAATGHDKATAWDLFEAITAVEALDVSEGQYQEFAAAAQAAQASTLAALRAKHSAAVAREDEAARQSAISDAVASAFQARQAELLQDQSRGLSDALASQPDAMLHAREAAAAIAAQAWTDEDPDAAASQPAQPAPETVDPDLVLAAAEQAPAPSLGEFPSEPPATLTVGQINERLAGGLSSAPIKTDQAGLQALGFARQTRPGPAAHFLASDWEAIKAAIIKHVGAL